MDTLFSVIIPIYNAERSLRRCLDSLLSQGEPSAELILINDGSTDSSPDICLEYARTCGNVRYFSQENRGVSAARNLGLRQAAGTYILFVDSDDYVDPAYFSTLRRVMAAREPELLLFSHKTVGRITYRVQVPSRFVEGPENVAAAVSKHIRDQSFYALWSKVYLRRIIEQYRLEFDPELRIDEDFTFSFSYALHAGSMQTISDTLYYFCVDNPESLSRKQRDYLQAQLLRASRSRFELLRDSGLGPNGSSQLYDALVWVHYRRVFSIAAELQKSQSPASTRRARLREACLAFESDGFRPQALPCRLIHLPVRLRLARLILLSTSFAVSSRRRRLNY